MTLGYECTINVMKGFKTEYRTALSSVEIKPDELQLIVTLLMHFVVVRFETGVVRQ